MTTWTPHTGNAQPAQTLGRTFHVQFRGGDQVAPLRLRWDRRDAPDDIVAWRLIEEFDQ